MSFIQQLTLVGVNYNTISINDVFNTLNVIQNIFVIDSLTAIGNKYKELFHYGVLGMKWGVRKDKDSQSKRISQIKTEYRENKNVIKKGGYKNFDFMRTKEQLDLIKANKQIKFNSFDDDIIVNSTIQNVLRNNGIDLTKSVYFSVMESDKKFWLDTEQAFGTKEKINTIKINELILKRPLKIAGYNSLNKAWMNANSNKILDNPNVLKESFKNMNNEVQKKILYKI